MNTVFLFPGQGSQFIEMGKELFDTFNEAKEVFQEVDDSLNQKLSTLMFSGDLTELTITSNTQPAIMAVSLAVMAVLRKQSGKSIEQLANYTAGHSLGEYSAYCSTETFSLKDTASLLRTRGNAMLTAAPNGVGAMVALVGCEFNNAISLVNACKEAGIIEIANDNGAGQIVLSGENTAIDLAITKASEFAIKRAIKLNVSSAFHSSLIMKAEPIMQEALSRVATKMPKIPVMTNYTADFSQSTDEIQQLLVKQITGMVRWRESMDKFTSMGITKFVEIGPGKVLSGIAKRIAPDATAISLHSPADIEEYLK